MTALVRTESLSVLSKEDAHVLLARLETSMEGLIELIEAETKLVRDGKLFAASELEQKKAECAQTYIELMQNAKEQEQALKAMMPDNLKKLRFRHDEFKALLRLNMAALSTAKSVTHNLIQGVAKQMGQTAAPTTYGAQGTLTNRSNLSAPGLTTDRPL